MFTKAGLRSEERVGGFSILNSQSGASLIELIMFIVIVSSALAGIMVVMNQTSKGSADPMLRKQAMAVAYSLLEEIELQDFIPASGVPSSPVTLANRTSTHIVSDYNGFSMAGIYSLSASSVLPNYNASVLVAPAALGSIAAASAVKISVTVTGPNNTTVVATGYRAANDPK
ncbi:MAG: hypothetical protein WCK93_07125 [Nitrosomonadales bacterium]